MMFIDPTDERVKSDVMGEQVKKFQPHHSEPPITLRAKEHKSGMSYTSDVGMIPETETMQQ